MPSPNPTKLSDHLAKFRYTPSSQSTSPKRRAVTQDDEPVPSPKRRLTTPLAEAASDSSAARTTPPKQRKLNRSYAAPETYAHLKAVPDLLRPGLTVVFCGIKALHGGGFTDRLYEPQECVWLPERFNIGMTNLVSRPTAEQAELSAKEMRTGALDLVLKILEHRPGIVCFVGKKIWDEFEFVIKKSARPAAKPWMDEVFPSGVAATVDVKPTAAKLTTTKKSASSSARPVFQWDQPRPYRVVHDSSPTGKGFSNTLFWVVPSTSGLVRVQLPEQIEHFKAVRRMMERIQEDAVDYDMFRQVDVAGVAATVATISK